MSSIVEQRMENLLQSAVKLQTKRMKIFKLYQRAVKYFENQEVYEDLVAKLLLISIETLSPVKICDGKRKISKTFLVLAIVPVIKAFLSLSHVIVESQKLHFQVITELLAIFFGSTRIEIDLLYVTIFHRNFAELVHRYIAERKSQQNLEAREITLKHYKNEFIAASIFTILPFFAMLLICASVFFREFNEHNLPIMSYPILKLENRFAAWLINYFFQTVSLFLVAIALVILFPMTFLLMNNSCWQIDQTILLLKSVENSEDVAQMIKRTVKQSYRAFTWISDVQSYLRFIFFIEFTIMATVFCMNFVSILVEPPGTAVIFGMIMVQVAQFFVICWLGQRVLDRIDELSAAIYDLKWYEMRVSDRKSIQLMLVMSQNLRGFNGIFKEVNMETFLTIVQFAYSLVMFFASF